MSQREEVATVLVNAIKKRIRFNLQLKITDDIVINLERSEFTELTGKSRIEDNSITYVAGQVERERWVWEGKPSASSFVIRVPVASMMTGFDSLESLREWNTKDSGLYGIRKHPIKAAQHA